MVIDMERALKSERLMKSLTGLSAQEFLNLVPVFRNVFFEIKKEKYDGAILADVVGLGKSEVVGFVKTSF